MKTKGENLKRLGFALGLAATAITGTASADPRYARYPGQMCDIRDFEVGDGYSSYIRDDFNGRTCNVHGSHDIKVTCPVPKLDWDAFVDEEYGADWGIDVTRKASGSFDWDCTAYSRDTEGDAYWYDDASPVSHLGGGDHTWYSMKMAVGRHHRYGYTHFQCVIPAGECLAGYETKHVNGSCSGDQDC
jgi:hypothetical protein